MVYGEKYGAYAIETIGNTISELSRRYNVKCFAFNDEAIPPKTLRSLGELLPPHSESGWSFTGLIKFEKFYQRSDFENAYRAGFRSLYVGLESASERVLALMKKNSSKGTMLRNLGDATQSGIWMHCFLFFGFPGETELEAEETYKFVLENSDKISSFGCGAFTLEHNAPISSHYKDFGVSISVGEMDNLDVYYDYTASDGISYARAKEWSNKLNVASTTVGRYTATNWIPRESLFTLLSRMDIHELRTLGHEVVSQKCILNRLRVGDYILVSPSTGGDNGLIVLNRLNRRTAIFFGSAGAAINEIVQSTITGGELRRISPLIVERLEDEKASVVRMYASEKVI